MKYNIKAHIAIILLVFVVIVSFAYSYNTSVTTRVNNAAAQDREFLESCNKEMISSLCGCESIRQWPKIVETYTDVEILIEDSSGSVIVGAQNKERTGPDVRVQSLFEYRGKAYLLVSSVSLFRNSGSVNKAFAKFITIELLILAAAFWLLVFIIYVSMLRPYHKLYRLIENYEKTGELSEVHFRGYIGKVYERFVSMTRHIERQRDNQKRIIASISHDIKTPLTSILGYTEQLQKDNLSEERKNRYLATVYQKSKEIQFLIDEFDEYPNFNKLKQANVEPVTTNELREYLLADYGTDLELNQIDFKVNCRCENCVIMMDKARMKRVFGNIFSNSLKHFKSGKKRIIVDILSDKDTVYINISDNGTGVDPEALEIIFEPLYTSDEGRKEAGLGLAICKEIIESHKGRIYAKPSVIGGLQICIEMKKEK